MEAKKTAREGLKRTKMETRQRGQRAQKHAGSQVRHQTGAAKHARGTAKPQARDFVILCSLLDFVLTADGLDSIVP